MFHACNYEFIGAQYVSCAVLLCRNAPLCLFDTRASNLKAQKQFLGSQATFISRPTDVVSVVFQHILENLSHHHPTTALCPSLTLQLGTYVG